MPRNNRIEKNRSRVYTRWRKRHAPIPMAPLALPRQNRWLNHPPPHHTTTSCSPETEPRTELEFEPGSGCGVGASEAAADRTTHRISYCYPSRTIRERRTLRLIHGWGSERGEMAPAATFERERKGSDARARHATVPRFLGRLGFCRDGWRWRLVLSRRSGRVGVSSKNKNHPRSLRSGAR
jgi:hypothetical protein